MNTYRKILSSRKPPRGGGLPDLPDGKPARYLANNKWKKDFTKYLTSKVGGDRARLIASAWHTARCHDFTLITLGLMSLGSLPGDESSGELLANAFAKKGDDNPFSEISIANVREGDIAVFFDSTGIKHSARVIRAPGGGRWDYSEIELVEKQNPRQHMSTRTVEEALGDFEKVRPKDPTTVRFLRYSPKAK